MMNTVTICNEPSSKKKKRVVRGGASATKQKQKQELAVSGGQLKSFANPAKSKTATPFAGSNNKTRHAPPAHLDGNNFDAVRRNRDEQNILSDTKSDDVSSSKSAESKRSNGSERSRVGLRQKMSELLELKHNNSKQRSHSSIAADTIRNNGRIAKQQQQQQQYDEESTHKKSSTTTSIGESEKGLQCCKNKKTQKRKQHSGRKKSNIRKTATSSRSKLEKCRAWWADEVVEPPQLPRRGPYQSAEHLAHHCRSSQYQEEEEDLSINLSKLMDMLSNAVDSSHDDNNKGRANICIDLEEEETVTEAAEVALEE